MLRHDRKSVLDLSCERSKAKNCMIVDWNFRTFLRQSLENVCLWAVCIGVAKWHYHATWRIMVVFKFHQRRSLGMGDSNSRNGNSTGSNPLGNDKSHVVSVNAITSASSRGCFMIAGLTSSKPMSFVTGSHVKCLSCTTTLINWVF